MCNSMDLNTEPKFRTETSYMFDKQLKILLKQQSISVIKLSKATGINAKTLYNYLDGRTPRDLKHVRTLCIYFGVTSDFILFGVLDTNKNTDKKEFKDYSDEINAGVFEVILRKQRG